MFCALRYSSLLHKTKATFRSAELSVIAFCEGTKRKRKLLRKERKLSAVKLVSAGENKLAKKRYWGKHFWAIGYGAWSAGDITDELVKAYLEHHRKSSNNDD